MRRAVWTAQATADLREVRDYLTENVNLDSAAQIIRDLVLAGDWLAQHPRIGPALGYSDWRKWKPRKSRYLIFYRVVDQGIEIVRVRHDATDWWPVPE